MVPTESHAARRLESGVLMEGLVARPLTNSSSDHRVRQDGDDFSPAERN